MEALGIGAVRRLASRWRADLRLLVVAHRDVVGMRPPRPPVATPSARPTTTRRSCRCRSRPRPSGRGSRWRVNSLWPAQTRIAAPATSRIARRSFGHRHGSSNQRGRSPRRAGTVARAWRRCSPGWRRRQHEVRRRRRSRATRNRAASSSGVSPPTLNFSRRGPSRGSRAISSAISRATVVVAADGDHRHAVAVAAPEPPQRLAERLADRVPDRGVDARHGDEAEPAVAQDVERRRPAELPAALDGEGVLADQPRRDLARGRSRRSRAAPRPRRPRTPRRRCPPP